MPDLYKGAHKIVITGLIVNLFHPKKKSLYWESELAYISLFNTPNNIGPK